MTTRRVYGQRQLRADVAKDRRDGWRVTAEEMNDRDGRECPRLHGDEGPCPYVGCKYHLWCDITPDGSLRVTHPQVDPWDMPVTCALDVAADGGAALEDIAASEGITRERIRQILMRAISKLAARSHVFAEALEERKDGIRSGGWLDTERVDGNIDRGDRDPRFRFPDTERLFTGRAAERRCREYAEKHGLDVVAAEDLDGAQRRRLRVGELEMDNGLAIVDEDGRPFVWAAIDPNGVEHTLEWVTREDQTRSLQAQIPGLEDGRRPKRRRTVIDRVETRCAADDEEKGGRYARQTSLF